MGPKPAANPYNVYPGVATNMAWIASLKHKTGRSLDEWMTFIEKHGPKTEPDRRAWLKEKHGLGTNAAWWLAERSVGKGDNEDTSEEYLKTSVRYVDDMFTGGKSGLRSIYDELLKIGLEIGAEAKACPCKTIVPLYRNHVFAEIKPATNSRIDLGLALGQHKGKIPKRLIDTGGAARKNRITHKIEITSLSDIHDDVRKWLRTAYDLDA